MRGKSFTPSSRILIEDSSNWRDVCREDTEEESEDAISRLSLSLPEHRQQCIEAGVNID